MIQVTFRLCLMVVITLSWVGNTAHGAGAAAGDDLKLVFPSGEYQGGRYNLRLDYFPNPLDPTNLYWKFNSVEPSSIVVECGGIADANLDITNACGLYAGNQYDFSMQNYINPDDPTALYWRMNNLTLRSGSIDAISGPNFECMDFGDITSVQSCISVCGGDVQCLLDCFNINVGFELALLLNNPTSSPIDLVLPPGLTFKPTDPSVQPMMVVVPDPIQMPPGQTTVCLPTYCINATLDPPTESDNYATGGIVPPGCLTEIVYLLQGKTIDGQERITVQDIIWNCTDSGVLSAADRATLQSL